MMGEFAVSEDGALRASVEFIVDESIGAVSEEMELEESGEIVDRGSVVAEGFGEVNSGVIVDAGSDVVADPVSIGVISKGSDRGSAGLLADDIDESAGLVVVIGSWVIVSVESGGAIT